LRNSYNLRENIVQVAIKKPDAVHAAKAIFVDFAGKGRRPRAPDTARYEAPFTNASVVAGIETVTSAPMARRA
jgi:hypothetical protein